MALSSAPRALKKPEKKKKVDGEIKLKLKHFIRIIKQTLEEIELIT